MAFRDEEVAPPGNANTDSSHEKINSTAHESKSNKAAFRKEF